MGGAHNCKKELVTFATPSSHPAWNLLGLLGLPDGLQGATSPSLVLSTTHCLRWGSHFSVSTFSIKFAALYPRHLFTLHSKVSCHLRNDVLLPLYNPSSQHAAGLGALTKEELNHTEVNWFGLFISTLKNKCFSEKFTNGNQIPQLDMLPPKYLNSAPYNQIRPSLPPDYPRELNYGPEKPLHDY